MSAAQRRRPKQSNLPLQERRERLPTRALRKGGLETHLANLVLPTFVIRLPNRAALREFITDADVTQTLVLEDSRSMNIGDPVGVHFDLQDPEICLQGLGVIRGRRPIGRGPTRSRAGIAIEIAGDEGEFGAVLREVAYSSLNFKRRERRFHVYFPATCSAGGAPLTGLVRDISATGMRLEFKEQPNTGQDIRVRLHPPGSRSFEIDARIVRQCGDGRSVGVEIKPGNDKSAESISALLARVSVVARLALS